MNKTAPSLVQTAPRVKIGAMVSETTYVAMCEYQAAHGVTFQHMINEALEDFCENVIPARMRREK